MYFYNITIDGLNIAATVRSQKQKHNPVDTVLVSAFTRDVKNMTFFNLYLIIFLSFCVGSKEPNGDILD